MTRYPLATCHAVYKILFNQSYPFSYDLRELGDYYLGYRRLMEHWHRHLPGQILDVSYEQLVLEPRQELQRVLEFCGLSWEGQCLRFHDQPGAVTTASAAQVRKPIYQSSLHLWRHYERELAPLARQLESGGLML